MTDLTAPSGRSYRLAASPGVRVVVANLGLACCALEVDAAIQRGLLTLDESAPAVESTVLVVAGTVTDALAPAVLRMAESLPEPLSVLSFGACSNSGGPYWDAPTVTKGVDRLLTVTEYVPGCPPRPEALVASLLRVAQGVRP